MLSSVRKVVTSKVITKTLGLRGHQLGRVTPITCLRMSIGCRVDKAIRIRTQEPSTEKTMEPAMQKHTQHMGWTDGQTDASLSQDGAHS